MAIDPPFESCAIPALPPPVSVPLTVFPTEICNYLHDRPATHRGFLTHRMPGDVYHQFMDAGFRRSGKVFYQPICRHCRECVPIRVPTNRFRPSKSQRRVLRRNDDLVVSIAPSISSDEKFDLYRRYVRERHDREPTADSRAAFDSFLCDSPVDTVEFHYRDSAGRLLGVGVCDVCPESLSSVYFYFDPDSVGRSLGTFGALTEIAWARAENIECYYLGYLVKLCEKMAYKANFLSSERLDADGIWRDESECGNICLPTPI